MDESTLRDLYVEKRMSMRAVAAQAGCSQTNVRYWLKKYGIRKQRQHTYVPGVGTKECTNCHETKDLADFYLNEKGRPGSWCRNCLNAQCVERQRRHKQLAVDYKGGRCIGCGFDTYIGALDFHHLDPTKKDYDISKVIRRSLTDAVKKGAGQVRTGLRQLPPDGARWPHPFR